MNISLWTALVLFSAVSIYLLIIKPSIDEKTDAAKKAALIAQRFDPHDPTLFSFEGKTEDGVEEVVIALCSKGHWGDEYLSDDVLEMARLYGHGPNGKISIRERKRALKRVDYTLSLLPFHVYHSTTNDTWPKFVEKRNYYRDQQKGEN